MRSIYYLLLSVLLITACQTHENRYTQQSPEIEIVKKHIENYNTKSYDTSVFADTSKSFLNNSKNGLSIDELVAYHKANDANYSNRGFTGEDPEYEMVVTDDGETWVNCWLDWRGTMAGNGKVIDIPVHLTYRFIDGKIVREVGFWDATEVVLNLQEIEASKNRSPEEKTVTSAMDKVVDAWNSNDAELMKSVLADNIVRSDNGTVVVNNSEEYVTNLLGVFHTSFPDFKVKVTSYKIAGNQIHLFWTVSGTNSQPFQGNPATNKPMAVNGHSIWTIDSNGKFTKEEAFFDNLSVFTQLGYSAPSL